jgi:hypothetical protein
MISVSICIDFASTRSNSPLENRFKETASPQGTNITSKGQHEWGHCGRETSPTGTEGTFEVHLDGEKIAEIYWSCPYIGNNKLEKRYVKPDYDISFDGFGFPSGPMGRGTINVVGEESED